LAFLRFHETCHRCQMFKLIRLKTIEYRDFTRDDRVLLNFFNVKMNRIEVCEEYKESNEQVEDGVVESEFDQEVSAKGVEIEICFNLKEEKIQKR